MRRIQQGNIPAQLSSFVGRRREIEGVRRQLATSRMVTLVGVGGAGKTRLALQVAADVGRAQPDGAWLVDLTQLQQPDLSIPEIHSPDVIATLVIATLGVPQQQAARPVELVADYLAVRQVLLVLDNCEHVSAACTLLVDRLLRACANLRVLATGREPLAVPGEVIFAVPPLPVPEPGPQRGPGDLAAYEAVELFVVRGQAAVPGFALTPVNADAVAELCRRLDGLPLAIELAAARVRVLSPQQILDRMGDRFALLTRGSRGAPARQHTLRACVEWSFDLCSKPERLLWARLSVFVGGFDLAAVEAVCGDDELGNDGLIDILAGLVDKSILERADGHGGNARYRMLETIREHGREKLIEAGEQAELQRHHRDWYRELTIRADREWVDRQAYWHATLIEEQGNLRAAIEFSLADPREAETALRIMVAVPQLYWWTQSLCGTGLNWFRRGLAQVRSPTVLRARAVTHAGFLAIQQGDEQTMNRPGASGDSLA